MYREQVGLNFIFSRVPDQDRDAHGHHVVSVLFHRFYEPALTAVNASACDATYEVTNNTSDI
jgi:hypothetical protein